MNDVYIIFFAIVFYAGVCVGAIWLGVRENLQTREQARAWRAVADALSRYYPDWAKPNATGKECAVLAVKHLSSVVKRNQSAVAPGTRTSVIRVNSGVMTGKTTWALSMLEGIELRGFGVCYCPQTQEQARHVRLHRKYKGPSFPVTTIGHSDFPAFVTCAVVDDALVIGMDPQGQPIYEEATQVLINSILRKMQLHTCPTQLFIIERN